MDVIRKDATIENTGADDEFPGTFEVILSTASKDRDGDELKSEDWEQPLPDHITFDQDHAMTVAGTVGSGTPSINDAGQLVVSGTYSSLPRAQEVRTLVREKHIRTTSVAFMTKKVTKGGQSTTVRELLNGAFVAIPSNREALVLASKAMLKAGARHSMADAEHIQAIHDHTIALGAQPAEEPDSKSGGAETAVKQLGVKTVAGSYEQRQQALSDALDGAYPEPATGGGYVYAYPLATFDDNVVFRVSGDTDDRGQWQASYTVGDDGTVTLGDAQRVTMVETVQPVAGSVPKGFRLVADAPKNIGSPSGAADSSAKDAAADPAAAASADAAAAGEAAATEADASEIHTRAARIRAMAALATLEGDEQS